MHGDTFQKSLYKTESSTNSAQVRDQTQIKVFCVLHALLW